MAEEIVKVTINGEEREVPAGLTVDGLLDHLRIKKKTAIVEHNRTVLKQKEFPDADVEAGDNLEIVKFVGGG